MLTSWRRWWRLFRYPPLVVISYSGQATPRPQVHVSVVHHGSSQGVYTWDANEQGNAMATMYGRGLAETVCRQLVDTREMKP